MKYLQYETNILKLAGGYHTAKEICNQPKLWDEVYFKLLAEKKNIKCFLDQAKSEEYLNVILTGAGSSAFIGEALAGTFQKNWKVNCRAISTTDIITHPESYFTKSIPTLLISFARSGDSPESFATLELANSYCDQLHTLTITCNKEGSLAKMHTKANSYLFVLPEESNDRSLAMTSSFSSMLLSALIILNINEIEQLKPIIGTIKDLGNFMLNHSLSTLKNIGTTKFQRMVFLGSGPLLGIARESHLKVQELTDGKVICKFDSFLGFRHGPKAVVNESTVLVYLLSNNPNSIDYESDLVGNVNKTAAGEKSLAIGNYKTNKNKFDYSIQFPEDILDLPEDFLTVFYILPAQIIGFYKSMELGLSPDSPSKSGAISRVVQGVKIYNPETSQEEH